MRKFINRICVYALSCVLLSASVLSGCNNEQTSEVQNSKNKNVKLWTAPSYIKIYQDTDYANEAEYSAWYNDDALNISMFINEKEGGQIILTPEYDVKEYTVSVSDLVGDNGKKISKESIAVYNQKYVDVMSNSKAHTNSTLGMVPDAILPFEKAVEYGENTIAASNNQGVYIEIDSKDVTAGEYTGDVKLLVDEKAYNVKLTVEVWGAKVPEENHLKSSFLLRQKELLDNEKDGTDEMYETYYEQFLDYRLNITKFTQSFDEQTYIDGLRKYYANPAVASLHFPRCEDSSRTNYDFVLAENWFKKIAELCFEDKTNYYSKLYYYLAIIDEPHITKTEDKVVPIFKGFAVARRNAIKALVENRVAYEVDDTLFNAVIDGIENFELLMTSSYREDFLYENNKLEPENPDEEYVITWCPYMSSYNTTIDADKHRNEGLDEWWYGCNYPVNPYPTYHLDDAILTSRLLSWMAYEYNVVGNLYWRVNYTSEENAFGVAESVENPYDITNDSQETHGEGLLVYPGMPYGINGFVPSLRLVSIRDGMEEYEILRATGEKCTELAVSAGYTDFDVNTTFSKLYQSLYDGTKVTGGANDFTAARELLSRFAVLVEKGTVITGIEDKSFSTFVKIYVEGGTLKINGTEADFIEKGSGKEYSVEIVQNKDSNYLNFTLEQDADKTAFEMFVGGKKEDISLNEITIKSNAKINDISVENNQDGSVTITTGGVKLKEDGSRWEDETQRIYLSGGVLSDTLKKSQGVTAIAIEIENPGEAFDLSVRYTGTKNPDDILEFTEARVEANGTAVVTIKTGALAWDFGAINELRFYLKSDNVYQERTIKIKSIIITY